MATPLTVAIQGGPASFHDSAAKKYFAGQQIDVLTCATFRQLCDTLQQGRADRAVMAIENLLAGRLLSNYALLQEYDFAILGELWLPIDQNLMALPGQELTATTKVLSHPVALQQCGGFLKQHAYLQPQETTDTADSAREIREKQLRGVAAIASRQAATLYGLQILQEDIADSSTNYTRFLLLGPAQHPQHEDASATKASLILQLPLTDGALDALGQLLQTLPLTVSLLQPLPPARQQQTLSVALDLESAGSQELLAAIAAIRPLVHTLKLLGLYPKTQHPVPATPETSAQPLNHLTR
ncbi:prephenate dehydratase domain-containing protein [Pontibacter liquoris]|uniref:prephenate dehydratase domain-containing protein n=1 Tax=Pontibacter liquoris TaxID=2905677 RepID=UPI001FA7FAE2|nr:prephenate dehydratase domain-containing protein [Pontibacter liquoris]